MDLWRRFTTDRPLMVLRPVERITELVIISTVLGGQLRIEWRVIGRLHSISISISNQSRMRGPGPARSSLAGEAELLNDGGTRS